MKLKLKEINGYYLLYLKINIISEFLIFDFTYNFLTFDLCSDFLSEIRTGYSVHFLCEWTGFVEAFVGGVHHAYTI